MKEFRAVLSAISFTLAFAMTLSGCSAKKPPVAGGGEHKVTGILIRAYSKQASAKDRGPVALLVGERVQLRVMAAWAIPSMTEETRRAAWTVSDPAVGDLDKEGVFTARKAGRTVVTAEIRVSENGASEVLNAGQAAKDRPVKTFRDDLELDVREPGASK